MITVVFGSVLPWLLIAIGTWLAYELVRQNGRVLLRLEAIEKSIGPRAVAEQREALGLPLGTIAPDFWLPDLAGVRHTLSEFREQRHALGSSQSSQTSRTSRKTQETSSTDTSMVEYSQNGNVEVVRPCEAHYALESRARNTSV